MEEYSLEATIKQIQKNFFSEAHSVECTSSKQLILPSQRVISPSTLKRNASAKVFESIDTGEINMIKSKLNYSQYIVDLANLLLSSLHIWSIDDSIDKLCFNSLGLRKPYYPVTFGRISKGSHLFIKFPSKFYNSEKFAPKNVYSDQSLPSSISFNLIDLDTEQVSDVAPPKNNAPIHSKIDDSTKENSNYMKAFLPSKKYWLSLKSITTEHILAVLAISDTLMNLEYFSYLNRNRYIN